MSLLPALHDTRRTSFPTSAETCPPDTGEGLRVPVASHAARIAAANRWDEFATQDAELDAEFWPIRVRICAMCPTTFVPYKVQRFCSSRCRMRCNQRIYRQRHPERMNEWGRRNPEARSRHNRTWRERHRDYDRERKRLKRLEMPGAGPEGPDPAPSPRSDWVGSHIFARICDRRAMLGDVTHIPAAPARTAQPSRESG